jgi:hypothetical protein
MNTAKAPKQKPWRTRATECIQNSTKPAQKNVLAALTWGDVQHLWSNMPSGETTEHERVRLLAQFDKRTPPSHSMNTAWLKAATQSVKACYSKRPGQKGSPPSNTLFVWPIRLHVQNAPSMLGKRQRTAPASALSSQSSSSTSSSSSSSSVSSSLPSRESPDAKKLRLFATNLQAAKEAKLGEKAAQQQARDLKVRVCLVHTRTNSTCAMCSLGRACCCARKF